MIKKYISKFTIDIAPSIIATIVGAYIVNHYISPKSDDSKPAAAMASTPDPKTDGAEGKSAEGKSAEGKSADVRVISLKSGDPKSYDAKSSDAKSSDSRPAENSADLAAETARTKAADKPAVEKASIDKVEPGSDARRHGPSPRDKAVAKATPAPVTPAVVAPVLATVGTAPAEASVDDRRDANDLARAAIERLSREQPRSQDAARAPEAPRAQEARVQEAIRMAPQQVQPMQQLPPPIVLATPGVDNFSSVQVARPDSRRLRPPGEIPTAVPVDLQADASNLRPDRTNVAEDVLSAAKSVFHTVTRPFDR
jgi:hypothetical protein